MRGRASGPRGDAFDIHPSAGTIACDRSREALEDARVVLEALADNLSPDVLDAAQDVREGRPDWRILRRLDFVAMAQAHTKRIVVAAIRRAAWRPWTG